MRRLVVCLGLLVGAGASGSSLMVACGGSSPADFANDASSGGSSSSGGNDPVLIGGGDGGSKGTAFTDGGCGGVQCQIQSCSSATGTTITGTIMDPAGANPLYNVLAYVPMYDPADPSAIPAGYGIQPITGGVNFPSGVTCDSCSYLYSGYPVAVGLSGTDGKFTITNAPSGANIPVVIQVGKWRTHTTVSNVPACGTADTGKISLPSKTVASDPIISIPQIAISMGTADSLECLPLRMGMDPSEFTSGASPTGHIHIFTGGGNGGQGGAPPESSGALWDSLTDLNKYDMTLFSCEGSETTNANPQLLEQYVNAGGRAFASHFHYAWLAGPLNGEGSGYTANPDWGNNLATWNANDQGADEGRTLGAKINTTLNVGGGTFAKGQALAEWLGNVGALGTSGVPATDVAVESPSYDPNVTSANAPSQAWATYEQDGGTGSGKHPHPGDPTGGFPTAYFSFDTPVGAAAPPDGGSPPYCGRVVFSGLHVGAAANDTTGGTQMPSTSTCNPLSGELSPQEKVLEYMIFDLSACVTPDTAAPGVPPIAIPPAPPPK
jgi:hypothetical protein